MKSRIADIGCYCLVALTLLGCIVSLATSASGRMILVLAGAQNQPVMGA